jgi:hypothetical protein
MRCAAAHAQRKEQPPFPVGRAAAALAVGTLLLCAGALDWGPEPKISGCACRYEIVPVSQAPLPMKEARAQKKAERPADSVALASGGQGGGPAAPGGPLGGPLPAAGEELRGARMAWGVSRGRMQPFDFSAAVVRAAAPRTRQGYSPAPELTERLEEQPLVPLR